MKNRGNKILELLTKDNKIEVSHLAEELGVSQVTMRKDLDTLESKGVIKREHGFALLCNGDTIMIENGSCCALLADTLTATKKDLTIITNSAFIAEYIRGKSNFQINLLGGIYQQDSQVMVGPMILQCVENFFVDRFFIGTDGYSTKMGFTNQDQMRAQAVRDMARQAEEVIVLTESEKFSKRGIVPLNLKDQVKAVITDSEIDSFYEVELISKRIQVIKA